MFYVYFCIYSILDQQQKQSIPFQGGQSMGEFDGHIFIASGREIYALVPVALDKQVNITACVIVTYIVQLEVFSR